MSQKNGRWVVMAGVCAAASLVGGATGWYLNLPPTEWMEFISLNASYHTGRSAIKTTGQYKVNNTCDPDRVIWRIEATATDGQVAEYGPQKPQPSLSLGTHRYDSSIPLEAAIYPDGWAVRILVTCPGEKPETVVSPPALVNIGESDSLP